METDKHVLFEYIEAIEARQVWKRRKEIQGSNSGSFLNVKDWFATLMEIRSKEETEHIAVILWLLWKSRNEDIFVGSGRGAGKIEQYGHLLLTEFKAAQTMREVSAGYRHHSNADSKWKPPQQNILKINVDAAFKDNEAGIGLLVRDYSGEVEAIMLGYFSQYSDSQHAEALGIMIAVQFVHESGITHFELEGDALSVVNKIESTQEDISMIGNLIAGIRSILKEFPVVHVNYVHRSLNSSAHASAKLALNKKCRQVWFTDFPQSVMNAVLLDSC